MYYFKRPYIIYRDYPEYGYLTDNRNFGYDTASKSSFKLGDRLLTKSGSVLYSALTAIPTPLQELLNKVHELFDGVSMSDLETDATDFYNELSKDGFIGQSDNPHEVVEEHPFSYKNKTPFHLPQENTYIKEDYSNEDWNVEYRLSRIHMNISGPCNEHCCHCYFPREYMMKTMSRVQFLDALEQCRALNVLNITLSGGEPLLNPDFAFFISECRENNFSINILSNLVLLTDELVSEFKKTPLLSVQTSLYSMDGRIHDSITNVKGSFEKTVRAIHILWENNIPVQINCPIMKQNKESYQGVIEWAKSLNIEAQYDYMLFGCFDNSKKNLECRLEPKDIRKILEQDESNITRQAHPSDIDNMNTTYSVCPVCVNSLCISYNGDVYPCEGWQSMVLGNINKIPLEKLWIESKVISQLRSLTIEDDFPQCAKCNNKDYCSICLIRNANESPTGDFRETNPYFCEIAKIKKELN